MKSSTLDAKTSSRAFLRRWAAFIAIILIGAALSWLAYSVAKGADDARVQSALENRAEWRAQDFQYKLHNAADPAAILAPLIAAQDDFDPIVFHRFVQLSRDPGDVADALIWAPLIRESERAAFVENARRTGIPDFDILDLTVSGTTAPAAQRHEYLPVWLAETFSGTRATPGLDLFVLPVRRGWAEEARDTGQPVAVPFSPVLANPSAPALFLVYVPVYLGGRAPATVAERQAAFRGLVVGRFRIAPLLASAIEGTPELVESIDFLVDADPRGFGPYQLASYDPSRKAFLESTAAVVAAGDINIARDFDLLGRHWTLISHFPAAHVAGLRSSAPFTWLGLGLLLTALIALYVQRERGRRFAIEAMVAARTADLSRTVNALATATNQRQQAEARLIQAQKMEAIGNLTGGLAHDFNNLLGIIIGNLDLLRGVANVKKDGQKEVDELAHEALDAAMRGADLTRRLLAFARRQPLQPERIELNGLVTGMVKLLGRTLGEAIEISLDLSPNVWPVLVDPAQLEASLANLATNARDAMPAGGKLMIATMNRFLDADYAEQFPEIRPGDYALIEVSDTGSGMLPDVMNHIFEPFFTTKPHGKGTGLGLSMVFGFMKQSGGHVNVYSEPGVGTTFRLYLPRAPEGPVLSDTRAIADAARAQGETVLAVEDNAALRRVVMRQLGDLGYRVLEAENAAAALALLAQEKVDLLFTDIIMAGEIDGYALAHEVRTRWPSVKVVLTSGFPQTRLNGDRDWRDEFQLLSKPYRREDLAKALRDALDAKDDDFHLTR
jgi:signal transduction histidine kinase/ActR/RegA family two-component response regulator